MKSLFPSSENKAKGILETIHSNVCGPMSTYSSNGYVYYVSFIDDFSRKYWIYFLKKKGEVFRKFKELKTLIDPGGYWWPPTYSTWTPTIASFSFSFSA
jgi:hypothetical protein